jgi:hypothetical protein
LICRDGALDLRNRIKSISFATDISNGLIQELYAFTPRVFRLLREFRLLDIEEDSVTPAFQRGNAIGRRGGVSPRNGRGNDRFAGRGSSPWQRRDLLSGRVLFPWFPVWHRDSPLSVRLWHGLGLTVVGVAARMLDDERLRERPDRWAVA